MKLYHNVHNLPITVISNIYKYRYSYKLNNKNIYYNSNLFTTNSSTQYYCRRPLLAVGFITRMLVSNVFGKNELNEAPSFRIFFHIMQ